MSPRTGVYRHRVDKSSDKEGPAMRVTTLRTEGEIYFHMLNTRDKETCCAAGHLSRAAAKEHADTLLETGAW